MPTKTDITTTQADFQTGVLTNVEADSLGFLCLSSTGSVYELSGTRESPELSLAFDVPVVDGPVKWDLSSIGEVTSSNISWTELPRIESFIEETLGAEPSVNWTVDTGSPIISNISDAGNQSCYFPGDGSYHRIRSSWSFPVQAGDIINGQIKALGDVNTAKLQLALVYDPYDYDAFSTIIDVNPNVAWTTYSGSIIVPSGVTNAYIWVFNYPGNDGAVWVDNVQIDVTSVNGTVKIETSVTTDAGASWSSWATCISNSSIPDLPVGTNTKEARLKCRQTLNTTDSSTTPRLYYLSITVEGEFNSVTVDSEGTQKQLSKYLDINGWQFTGVFSSTDADTVAWTSGMLYFSQGDYATISSGDTGNIIDKTYIYFSKEDSTTSLQSSTAPNDAVGLNKVLMAVAEKGTDEASFYVYGGSGGLKINETNISDNSISTPKLQANAVTANEILANTITSNEIESNTITASQIATGTITSNELNFTPTDSSNIIGAINASSEGLQITGQKIEINGDTNVAGTFTITAANNISDAGNLATQNTADWGTQIIGTGKPADNADVTSQNTAKDMVNLPSVTGTPGLIATSSYLGFHNGSSWKSYMSNTGTFYLIGSGSHGLSWDGNILTITGNLIVGNPSSVRTALNVADGADVTSQNTAKDITGQGALATQNSVDYTAVTGTKPPSNADVTSSHTANDTSKVNSLPASYVSNWAHPSNQTLINGGYLYNYSITATKIAANAVTATKIAANSITATNGAIQNLSVDTIKIKDNAITNRASSNSWSVAITTHGYQVFISWSCTTQAGSGIQIIYLSRDSTSLQSVGCTSNAGCAGSYLDTPPAGAHSYSISGDVSGAVMNPTIFVMEIKK